MRARIHMNTHIHTNTCMDACLAYEEIVVVKRA